MQEAAQEYDGFQTSRIAGLERLWENCEWQQDAV